MADQKDREHSGKIPIARPERIPRISGRSSGRKPERILRPDR